MTSMPQTVPAIEDSSDGDWEGRFDDTVNELRERVRRAAREGTPIYELEKDIFRSVLAVGRQALGLFLELSGDGDLGEALDLPDGREVRRLKVPRARAYLSVFGEFRISRWVYGSREGQRIEHVPLDSRLDLPRSKFSYLLQEWSQQFAVDQAFAQASANLETLLDVRIPVHSLERISRDMAEEVVDYWDSLPVPPREEEGELVVATADFKGVPMKGTETPPPSPAGRPQPKKEVREGKKQMALLGGVYTVDPVARTVEEVVEALFRKPAQGESEGNRRPRPRHKRLRASLERDERGTTEPAVAEIFGWMACEIEDRAPALDQPILALMDGQGSLWDAASQHFDVETVEILDLLHVTPRLWRAAHLFYPKDSPEILPFVKHRVRRILAGEVLAVVKGLRSMATRRRLPKKKRDKLQKICRYLERNAERMHYHDYLARGFPIATGVIEGACRHLVKDRLERSGMRWVRAGAQALLDLRTIHAAKLWDSFQDSRRATEQRRLYPFRGRCDTRQLQLV